MKAFLLAAGLGTRLKPFTDKHPKALATVNGKTLLEHTIRNLQQFDITDIVVNVHHFAGQIIETLEENNGFGSRFTISDESEKLLETGGALKFASSIFEKDDNILMMNVDILTNLNFKSLIHYHLIHQPLATLAVQERDSSRKLIFNENQHEEWLLNGWINTQTNEKKPQNLSIHNDMRERAFSGIQIVNQQIFDLFNEEDKFSIIDTYLANMEHKIVAYDHSNDLLLDVGKPESLDKAEQIFS